MSSEAKTTALKYSPTHTIVRGKLKGLICEVADFCALVKEIYHDFGFDEIWDKAEAALAEATKLAGLDYILNPGEGAFYGPKSVQNECRRKMLAFFYDRVQPRTPSASTSNSRSRIASVVTGSAVRSRWTSTCRSASAPNMSARTTSNAQGESSKNTLAYFYW